LAQFAHRVCHREEKDTALKLIIAIIPPEKLEAVEAVLNLPSLTLLSVSQVLGGGRERGSTRIYRGATFQVRRSKLRLEIVATDAAAAAAVTAVVAAAGGAEPDNQSQVFVMEMNTDPGERGNGHSPMTLAT
jgi:nitrogen regulatory protein P-II 2